MADIGYTKTGESWLSRTANTLSYIPFGGFISAGLNGLDTLLQSAGWLFRGKLLSALTTLGTGSAAVAMNLAEATPLSPVYWINVASGVTTGHSATTYARKLTEGAVDLVTKPLGVEPTVLRSYTAGIGSLDYASVPTQPGVFASAEAARRGRNSQEMYDAYMNGEGGVNVAQLNSANGRGA